MSVNKASLFATAIGSFFVFVVLASFGMNLVLAALFASSLIVVNLIWTALSERATRRHAAERAARRSATLASTNDAKS